MILVFYSQSGRIYGGNHIMSWAFSKPLASFKISLKRYMIEQNCLHIKPNMFKLSLL